MKLTTFGGMTKEQADALYSAILHASRHAAGGDDAITSLLNAAAIPPLLKPYLEVTLVNNADYVDLTDLDINTHKAYYIKATFTNPTTSLADLNLYINGNTAGSYSGQNMYSNDFTVGGGYRNSAWIGTIGAGDTMTLDLFLVKDPNGRMCGNGLTCMFPGSNLNVVAVSVTSNFTVTNITSIRIAASVSGALGAGSRILLFRLGG
jgi:hypothetical protein